LRLPAPQMSRCPFWGSCPAILAEVFAILTSGRRRTAKKNQFGPPSDRLILVSDAGIGRSHTESRQHDPIASAGMRPPLAMTRPTKMIVDCGAGWDSASLATMFDVFRDVAPH
jgi:hypothetical protein